MPSWKLAVTAAFSTLAAVQAAASSGFSRDWTSANAAAEGQGYISSYASSETMAYTDFTLRCANSCREVANCAFFNIYQEASTNPLMNICVLWDNAKPFSTATNTFNGGKPVSNSIGYRATSATDPSPGFTLEWTSPNAAADGSGYLSAFLASDAVFYNELIAACGSACSSNANCAFFNVYQELRDSTGDNICVLWRQDKPSSSATNTFNGGKPVSNSGGYVKLVSSTTDSSSSSSFTTVRTSSSATVETSSTTTTSSESTNVPATGYTVEWKSENASADGPGYISSYVSETSSYAALVADCAASCSSNTGCAFFNVYQELSSRPTANICVLWNQNKPASSATNSANMNKPISNSTGYVKDAPMASTTTANAPEPTGTDVPGYSVEWTSSNAAADGPGYIRSFVSGLRGFSSRVIAECANACSSDANCAFFNIYQDTDGSSENNVCVLWNQDKPLASATNTFNGGRPIMNSAGYLRAVPAMSSTSSTSSSTSATSVISSTSVLTSTISSSTSRAIDSTTTGNVQIPNPTQVVVNPGFETEALPPWFQTSGNPISVQQRATHSGSNVAFLRALDGNPVRIEQQLQNLIPGAAYTLEFFYRVAANPEDACRVRSRLNDVLQTDEPLVSSESYQAVRTTIIPTSDSAPLAISLVCGESMLTSAIFLDDVTVTLQVTAQTTTSSALGNSQSSSSSDSVISSTSSTSTAVISSTTTQTTSSSMSTSSTTSTSSTPTLSATTSTSTTLTTMITSTTSATLTSSSLTSSSTTTSLAPSSTTSSVVVPSPTPIIRNSGFEDVDSAGGHTTPWTVEYGQIQSNAASTMKAASGSWLAVLRSNSFPNMPRLSQNLVNLNSNVDYILKYSYRADKIPVGIRIDIRFSSDQFINPINGFNNDYVPSNVFVSSATTSFVTETVPIRFPYDLRNFAATFKIEMLDFGGINPVIRQESVLSLDDVTLTLA